MNDTYSEKVNNLVYFTMSRTIKKLCLVFRKRYGQILLGILLLIISILSLRWGKHLLSNDNYSPELNPKLSIERYLLSPAWRGYRVLGVPSDSEQADIFRSIIFYVLKPILPDWFLGQFFYILCLVIGSISTASLTSSILQKGKWKNYSQIGYLLSGVIYISTLWTMWLYYQNMAPYISNFGFFPLLFLASYKYIQNPTKKRGLLLLLSSILFTSVSVISTLFILDSLVYIGFVLCIPLLLDVEKRNAMRRVVKTIFIFLTTQLFWIFPFIHYTITNSQNVVDSYTNKTITASTIDLETEMQNWLNSARLYNRNLYEVDGNRPLFSMSAEFQHYDFYKVVGLLPAFFAVLAMVFSVFKKNKRIFYFAFLAFTSWFLMKVGNPPFGRIFVWMQEYVPLFKQVLRWPFSKVGQIYVWSVTITGTFGIIYFVSFLSSFFKRRKVKKIFKCTIFFFILSLSLFYSEYLFKGELFADRAAVVLPKEYEELKEYLEENTNLTDRIYYAPPANNNYFRKYKWGFWGSQFISYVVPNPMMDMSSAVGSGVGESAMLEMSNIFRSYNREKFFSLLQKYDVKYVLLDESLEYGGYVFDVDKEGVAQVLSGYEIVWNSGFLKLYKVPSQENILTETFSSSSYDQNVFVRERKNSPSLNISSLSLSNKVFVDNYIVGDFTYDGETYYVSPNIEYKDLVTYPAYMKIYGNEIQVIPSYPHIKGDDTVLPFKKFAKSNYDYYVVDDKIFSNHQVDTGITVEKNFSSVNKIWGVRDDSFTTANLIPSILKSEGSDCSGNEIVNNTNVQSLEISSGLSLKGSSQLPCVYSKIHSLNIANNYVLKVKLNWEAENGSYPGYCLYSESKQRCLNKEKFFDVSNSYGDSEFLIDTIVRGSDRLTLILYVVGTDSVSSAEATFKKVELKYAPIHEVLKVKTASDTFEISDLLLVSGSKYTIKIPAIYGDSSYIYDERKVDNALWELVKDSSSSSGYIGVSAENGMKQTVEKQSVSQLVDLFKTEKNERYLLYWNGRNISNIPANLCFIYSFDEKCWYQDMFNIDTFSSEIRFFDSASIEGKTKLIYGSGSNKLRSENILKSLVIMKYPLLWESIKYQGNSKIEYKEIELAPRYSNNLSYYRSSIQDSDNNTLLSISQSASSGWLAFGRNEEGLSLIENDKKVTINGWKQGWDISGKNYSEIIVLYWPNLLSYVGYVMLILLILVYIAKILRHSKYEIR